LPATSWTFTRRVPPFPPADLVVAGQFLLLGPR
jgi:hypothetical protein